MSQADSSGNATKLVALGTEHPVWDRFFQVCPLVVTGTREEDGSFDLAPKHMAMPIGWENRLGFVRTPGHATCGNAQREGVFTVNFPRPPQVLFESHAAAPRSEEDTKPALDLLTTRPATMVDGVLLEDGLRDPDRDDADVFASNPLLAYLAPGRYAEVRETLTFPLHAGWLP